VKNFSKVFLTFKKNYKPIPLEVFGKNPYKVLVSVLLSSRTLDSTTKVSAERLFRIAPNFKKLSLLSESSIEKLIYPVGFYKTKAKQLKTLSEIILRDFSGSVPKNPEDLTKLPGVGRKTANLVLSRAFGKPAIAVDTHVQKITNLLGWVKTNSPDQTTDRLEKILPKKYWGEINRLFVSIGQQYRGGKLISFLKKNKLLK